MKDTRKDIAEQSYMLFQEITLRDIYLLMACVVIPFFTIGFLLIFSLTAFYRFPPLESRLPLYYAEYSDPAETEENPPLACIYLRYSPDAPQQTTIGLDDRECPDWATLHNAMADKIKTLKKGEAIWFKIYPDAKAPLQSIINALNLCYKTKTHAITFNGDTQSVLIGKPDPSGLAGIVRPSFLDIIRKGGFIGLLIILSGVIALALAIIYLFKMGWAKFCPQAVITGLQHQLKTRQYQQASEFCRKNKNPFCNVINSAIPGIERNSEEFDKIAEWSLKKEILRLNRGINIFLGIGILALMLGFMGTTIGFNELYQGARTMSMPVLILLWGEVYMPLVNVIQGLIVGIMTLIIYFYFRNKLNHHIVGMSIIVKEFIKDLKTTTRK